MHLHGSRFCNVRHWLFAASICMWVPSLVMGQATDDTNTTVKSDTRPPAYLKPLTDEQQEKLLKERLDGGMGNSFRQFSNMFW